MPGIYQFRGAKICIKIADEAACSLAGLPNICGCQKSKEINQNATIDDDQPQGAKRQQKAIKGRQIGRRKRQTDVCPRRLVAAAASQVYTSFFLYFFFATFAASSGRRTAPCL